MLVVDPKEKGSGDEEVDLGADVFPATSLSVFPNPHNMSDTTVASCIRKFNKNKRERKKKKKKKRKRERGRERERERGRESDI